MKVRTCSIIGVGLLVCGVAAGARSAVTAEDLGLDFWRVPDLENQVASGEDRYAELDRQDDAVKARMVVRNQLLADLLAAKITLDEAGRAFLALNRQDTSIIEAMRLYHPAGTDSDRAFRQVVRHMAAMASPGCRDRAEDLKCELAARHPHIDLR